MLTHALQEVSHDTACLLASHLIQCHGWQSVCDIVLLFLSRSSHGQQIVSDNAFFVSISLIPMPLPIGSKWHCNYPSHSLSFHDHDQQRVSDTAQFSAGLSHHNSHHMMNRMSVTLCMFICSSHSITWLINRKWVHYKISTKLSQHI